MHYIDYCFTKCMADVGDFIYEQQQYEIQLAEFFSWEYNTNQSKGSSFDFISPDGIRIEAKFDWDSIKTGNHYLEYGQTSSGKKGESPSGFSLSANDADFWIVINEEFIRFYSIQALKDFLKQNRSNLRKTRTRIGINNNKVDQYSLGFLIPFKQLDDLCFVKFESPFLR